jgi:hypothetical protein
MSRPPLVCLALGIVCLGACNSNRPSRSVARQPAASARKPPAAAAATDKGGEEAATFDMREVSAFDKNDIQPYPGWLTGGDCAECSTEPDKEVKAYPKLKSKHPLYGKVIFDRDIIAGRRKGIELHFVLDESGEAPGKKSSDKGPKQSPYDRLFIDVNRNLDLTDDPVLKLMKDPPWQALPPWQVKERTAFECMRVDVDFGPGVGVRPFCIFPWLTVLDDGDHPCMMHFVATTARRGRIRVGKHEYDALLAQPCVVSGRFDRPFTKLLLKPVDGKERLANSGFAQGMLISALQVDGQLYTTSATPSGDKLTVQQFRGDFGLFRIGTRNRDVQPITFRGSLASESMAIGLSSDEGAGGDEEEVAEYKVPVGDYLPSYLTIRHGHLSISLSESYHSEGAPRDMGRHPRTFFIKIRKDKPFVLNFSSQPKVIFTTPVKDKIFKPGDEIKIAAVLTDPVLDIMIRRLDDTSRKKKETVKLADGKETSYERKLSLDPVVTITDSSGKKVSEGEMPFG